VVARCASSRRARAAISWSVLAASSTTASRPATRSATMRTADGHPYLQLLRAPAPHPPRIRPASGGRRWPFRRAAAVTPGTLAYLFDSCHLLGDLIVVVRRIRYYV
jgi:hypothetical protein